MNDRLHIEHLYGFSPVSVDNCSLQEGDESGDILYMTRHSGFSSVSATIGEVVGIVERFDGRNGVLKGLETSSSSGLVIVDSVVDMMSPDSVFICPAIFI